MFETMIKRMRNRDLEYIYDGPAACSKLGARLDCVLINVSSVDNCRNGVHAKITSDRVTSGDHYTRIITIPLSYSESSLTIRTRVRITLFRLLTFNTHLYSY